MMTSRRYTATDKTAWDDLVRASKNGTFLFLRDYMEYHHERFTDHSLLFYDSKERLVALLPAHETETDGVRTLASHMGLTYGGLVLTAKVGAADVLDIFDSLNHYAQENGFRRITYKPVPTIYHLLPAEEDRYALFRVGAVQEACNISCVVSLKTTCSFFAERRRFRGKHRAENLGYHVAEGTLADFWPILEGNLLQRYGVRPVHSLAEMQYLQGCFPQQIRCYLALDAQGQPQAGAVLYVSQQTVHVQYGHCTPQGRQNGALDMLYFWLIERCSKETTLRFFDFGTSNEQQGHVLNENLIRQKEGFGGQGVAYATYRWDIDK